MHRDHCSSHASYCNFAKPLDMFLHLPSFYPAFLLLFTAKLLRLVSTPCCCFITSHSSPLQSGFHPITPQKQLPQRSLMTSVLLNPKDILQFSSYLQLTLLTTLSFWKYCLRLWLPFLFLLCAPSLCYLLCTFPDLLEFMKAESRTCPSSPLSYPPWMIIPL